MTERLVRYISPFGSPAWMTREKALHYLKEDDTRWVLLSQAGLLSEREKEVGAPRIEFSP